jgi:hypothetical protein
MLVENRHSLIQIKGGTQRQIIVLRHLCRKEELLRTVPHARKEQLAPGCC